MLNGIDKEMEYVFNGLNQKQLETMVKGFRAYSFRNAIHDVDDLIWSLKVDPSEIGKHTLEDMAEITGLSVLTLRQYVREKKIVANKKWKSWMVSNNEIARFMYQRETGKTIPLDISVGILIHWDTEMGDTNHNYILDYKFFNVLDMGEWKWDGSYKGNYYSGYWSNLYKQFNKTDIEIAIEVMNDFPDFFEKVGLLSNKNEFFLTTDHLTITPDKRKKLSELAYGSCEVGNESLMEIKDIFGEPNQKITTLKMYREILSLTYKYNEASHVRDRTMEELRELREKVNTRTILD
jgi:hypothetical protein